MKQKIKNVLAKPQEEHDEFKEKARQFVLKNNNSVVHTKKIVEMIGRNKVKKKMIME